MTVPAFRRAQLGGLALVAALLPVASADAQTKGVRATAIAHPAAANGPSANTTFSQDNRVVRLMAFDSAASNLLGGDTNGRRDVFLLRRSGLGGSLARVSVGRGGKQANGDSIKPSIDGQVRRSPHCVTFESTATNLDGRDRAADSDIYLRDLRRGATSLVSVGHRNARNGVVDGECQFVTYEASGLVFVRDLKAKRTYRIARGRNPDQQTNGKGVAYERGGQIRYQAYQKVHNRGKPKVKKQGREVLASAGRSAGNGVSRNPMMDDNGFYVAFESTATNLCTGICTGISEDRNGATSDIFRRTLSRRAPHRTKMQMASFSFGVSAQGNGPSNNPSMTGAGENIAFDSTATNLRQSEHITEIDPNGPVRDVYYWNYPRRRSHGNVSRESKPGVKGEFNGASVNPSTSNRANYIGFESTQVGASGEANGAGIADVFLRFLGHGPS